MDKTHEESTVLKMIGQYLELVLVFLRKIHPLKLTPTQIDKLMQKEHPFWSAFEQCLDTLRVPQLDDDTARQIGFWSKFYKEHFSIALDLAGVKIPARVAGFNWLIIVPQGVTLNQVWEICRKQFNCWKYSDSDLESVVTKNDRDSKSGTYAIWVRNVVEADEEMKNLSANDLEKQCVKGVTVLERLILELKYFSETEKHLDMDNWTLCSGSRSSDGGVPGVGWDRVHRRLFVHWALPALRDGRLRSRVAVTL